MPMPSFTKTYHHKPYPAISPTRPELSGRDKVVLITGAGSGVGEATAYAFAEAEAKVVVLGGRRLNLLQNVQRNIESKSPSTIAATYALDITQEDQVTEVFRDVKEHYGPIDICVNSAGMIADKGTIEETSLSNFWESMEVTIKGSFLITQHFLRTRSSNDPVLISYNSLLAHFAATDVKTAPASYATSKMAQGKMIEYVASENEGTVRAYSVHPGVIVSDMSTKSLNMSEDPEATRAANVWDDVNLPGHFCVWLASPEGRAIPSGKYLWSHWDVDELRQRSEELFKDKMALTLTLSGWPFPLPEVENM